MEFEIRGTAPLLQVYDMPTTLQFYRDVLGWIVIESSEPGDDADWVWLRWHGIDLMFNTAYEREYRPAQPDDQRIAAHQDTSIYFGCVNIDAFYKFLVEKGVQVNEPSLTKYGWKALYVKDPDNYLLVFHWPVEEHHS
jgi:glyoxylase I family protein